MPQEEKTLCISILRALSGYNGVDAIEFHQHGNYWNIYSVNPV